MKREIQEYLLLLLPGLALLTFVMLYPLTQGLYMSMFRWSLYAGSKPVFVGFRNYMVILQSQQLFSSLAITLMFTVLAVALSFLLGFGMALLLNSLKTGRGLAMNLLVIPIMVPTVLSGAAMYFMLNPSFGVVNNMLGLVGLPIINWFDQSLALLTIAIADVWRTAPFVMLVILAGLSSLPRAPIEAALLDGASKLQILRHIVIPMLNWHIAFVLSIRIMDAFRTFDLVYLLTGGGPGRATEVLTFFNYRIAFGEQELGAGSAVGWITVLIMLLMLVPFMRLMRRRVQ